MRVQVGKGRRLKPIYCHVSFCLSGYLIHIRRRTTGQSTVTGHDCVDADVVMQL